MEFFAISGLLNGLAAIGLASFVYFRSPQDPRHWTFGLFGISTAVWSFGYFAWQVSDTELYALFNMRLLMAGAIFIPITFLHHVVYLLRKEDSWGRVLVWNYGIGGGFLISDATPFFIQSVRPISIFPFWGVPGPAFHLCLIWWFGLVIIAHYLLIRAYRSERGLRRRQFVFLLLGSTIGYVGGATNFPLWYEIDILPYGTPGFALYIAIVAYTLLRFHWLDYSIYVEKGMSYFALLLLVSQPIYPVLLLAQKSIFGAINLRFSVLQLVLHLLTVAGAYQLKVGTKGAVARTILKGRELKIQTLANFSSQLTNNHTVSELGQTVLTTLGRASGLSKAALLVWKVEENRYQLVTSFGCSAQIPILQKGWALSDEIPQWLMFHQSVFSTPERKQHSLDDWERKVGQEIERIGFEVVYPLFSNQQLLGVLAVGPGFAEAIEVIGGKMVWNTILQEMGLALENSILREEVQRSQKLWCRVDRLRSLRTMTHGLTQELSHPLVSMKACVQIAHLRRDDQEFVSRLDRIIGEDFEKIDELTQEIREYVKPLSNAGGSQANIHEVIDSCLLFLASNPLYHSLVIEKTFSSHPPLVWMDKQELMQALFNCFLFLLKATPPMSGTLRIETTSEFKGMGDHWFAVDLGWKIQSAMEAGKFVQVESWNWETFDEEVHDSQAVHGLRLSHQILQRYHGNCRLIVSPQQSIQGIRVQIPLHLPENMPVPIGSFPLASPPGSQDKISFKTDP